MAEFNPTLAGGRNLATENADETINRETFLIRYLQTTFRTFKDSTVFMDKITKKTLAKGAKAATFYYTGIKQVKFLKRAEEAKGDPMNYNSSEIHLDDIMYCDSFIADVDQHMSVLDVIAENAREDGIALAREVDVQINIMIQKAASLNARVNNPDGTPRPGGSVVTLGAAGDEDDANKLVAAIKVLAQEFDEKNVPKDGRCLVMSPAVFYTLLDADKLINADYSSGNGDFAEAKLKGVMGFRVFVSNLIVTEDTSLWKAIDGVTPKYEGLQDKYNFDGTDTLMIGFTKGAAGMCVARDLKVERVRQPRAQGEFIMTTIFKGIDSLNPVEAGLIKKFSA